MSCVVRCKIPVALSAVSDIFVGLVAKYYKIKMGKLRYEYVQVSA
jgi:hypothetical protein